MDNTVKRLIIVVVILVAILGVSVGVILQSHLFGNKDPTILNQTNITLNQTSNSGNQTNSGNISTNNKSNQNTSTKDIISFDKAIAIAKNADPNVRGNSVDAKLFLNDVNPYYKITFYTVLTYADGEIYNNHYVTAVHVVDAKTGRFMG